MRERTSKKAFPKQNQLRRSAEAQETMGNLQHKKQRPAKKSSQTRYPHTPAFWEKLIINWHNYSLAQKIAVITAGLVLSGVAVYLAVGLAQSVYANMSADLDTPSRTTREPSVFTRIDRALSFPVTRAESLPRSPLHKLYPEFLSGTKEHPKVIADEMDANMKIIASPIISFLEKNKYEKVVVLGIAEHHEETGLLTTNVFATVKAWQEHRPTTNVTVIKELWNPSPEHEKQVNQAFTHFHAPNADEKSAAYKKELDALLSTYCFKIEGEGLLNLCAALSAKARQFDFTFTTTSLNQPPGQKEQYKKQEALANSYRHPTGDINLLDITKTSGGQVASQDQFPHEVKLIDHRITKTIRDIIKNHKYSTPPQQLLLVAWFGAIHALTVSNMLDTAKIPHRLLKMQFDDTHPHETKERYATNCIVSKDKCPPEILAFAQTRLKETNEPMTFRYCVLPIPYDEKRCDRVLHENNKLFIERNKFSRNIAHQVPPLLPSELPYNFRGRKISYFFATEKSVKLVRQEIADQEHERQRVEL